MKDTFGLIPPQIREQIEREEMVEHHKRGAEWLSKILRAEDPNLSCVWVRDDVHPAFAEHHGLRPGRWHVRRKNPGLPDSYMPIINPDGSYREPSFTVLEELRSRDLTRPGALQDLQDRHYREQKQREKDQALKDEQRQYEIKADIKTGNRVAGDGGMRRRKWAKGLVG